jgi:hypothetical protein
MTQTGYITYDAQAARLEDLHRRAAHRRTRREPEVEPVAIRHAVPADRDTIERLAALDSAEVPTGEILIAEVAGEPRAAIDVAGGRTVADPFQRTRHAVEQLTSRSAELRKAATPRRRLRLSYRTA